MLCKIRTRGAAPRDLLCTRASGTSWSPSAAFDTCRVRRVQPASAMMWRAALAGWLIRPPRRSPRSRRGREMPAIGLATGGTNWSQKYWPSSIDSGNNSSLLRERGRGCRPDFEIVKRGFFGTTISPPLSATELKGTPLVVDGTMYMTRPRPNRRGMNPASGATKWLYNPESYKDGKLGERCRPLADTRRRVLWSNTDGDGGLLAVSAEQQMCSCG